MSISSWTGFMKAIIFLFIFITSSAFGNSNITHYQVGSRYNYQLELLNLIFTKTEIKWGTLKTTPVSGDSVTPERGRRMLERGEIDIVFLPYSQDLDKRFKVVKYPILQGILGYRIFLINKDKKEKFKSVQNVNELIRNFSAGFGSHWSDLRILRQNKIAVETTPIYKNLFYMLQMNRFDYFPRGINEIWGEKDNFGNIYNKIIIEEKLALYYPLPVNFFVNKQNSKLAKRIKEGLEIVSKDGSLKKLFIHHYADLIKKAKLSERTIFKLQNTEIEYKMVKELDNPWWIGSAKKSGL